jgi:hypothetical protein
MIAIAIATGQNSAGLDPAASAFIQATGITGELQKAAINNLVLNLKKYNIWSKMKAVYPFVTDIKNVFNYTEDFSNAYWFKNALSISSNTINAPNGTLTADSIVENTANDGRYIGVALGLSLTAAPYTMSVYLKKANRDWFSLGLFNGVDSKTAWFNLNTGTIGTIQSGITASISDAGNGWFRCSVTRTMSGVLTNYLGMSPALTDGGAAYLGNGTTASYIWGAQIELGSTATTYQPILTTQQAFIANQFKYNLVNPVDSDAAFRLVFNGGWTHSSNGAQPNGTNGYADTKFVPSTNGLAYNNNHVSIYSRTSAQSGAIQFYEMGSGNTSGNNNLSLFARRSTNLAGYDSGDFTTNRASFSNTDGQGFYCGTAPSTTAKYFKNGVSQVSKSLTATSISNFNVFIGGFNENNNVTYYSNKQTAFSSIGNGLTDDDATNLYYSTQVFQTTLGRQVGSPAYALPAVNDVNAKLYLSAINSSDPTVNGAVDTFISGLKTDGIYSKMKAVYPFATDNRNLLSYTEDFSNAYWFKNALSITANSITAPNGTLTADSIVENTANTDHYISTAGSLTLTVAPYTYSVYCKKATRDWINVNLYNGTDVKAAWFNLDTGTIGTVQSGLTASITDVGNGWYRCSITRTMSTGINYCGIAPQIADNGGTYLGNGTTASYIWGAQLELGSTATTYQQIATTQQAYIATQFKYNMINPQDDDSAFRLVFNGGWTHSPQGATPNGTNGFADTYLNTSTNLTASSIHISSYLRTNSDGVFNEIGAYNTNLNAALSLYPRLTNISYNDIGLANTGRVTYANTDSRGYYIASRTSNILLKAYKNNTLNGSYTIADNTTYGSVKVFLSAQSANNVAAQYSNRQTAFSSIGDGLSDAEAANLYTRVQNLQTLLNRQV